MKFCRIDLSKTNYSIDAIPDWCYLTPTQNFIEKMNDIYKKYCAYKKFESVMPIFDSQYTDDSTDRIGYYHQNKLVAFSLIKKYDNKNAEAVQFAWNYEQCDLKFGIKSLEVECALYKSLGFKYLYLGQVSDYKIKFDGYEEITNPYV